MLLADRKMQSIELAERLGCTVQTVSRIKTGKVKAFRMETLDDICEIFGCQPGDVLEYVPDGETGPPGPRSSRGAGEGGA